MGSIFYSSPETLRSAGARRIVVNSGSINIWLLWSQDWLRPWHREREFPCRIFQLDVEIRLARYDRFGSLKRQKIA